MTAYRGDTIAALATPIGIGALAIIRISGNNLQPVIHSLTKKQSLQPRYATFTKLYSTNPEQLLDQCLITYFKAPHSYTGEDVLEISCHGGVYVPKSILNALTQLGVRAADPGEFSFRAFMNDKIDLIQAESIASLISSKTHAGADANLFNITGKLSDRLLSLKNRILKLLTIIEHELDFSEEEITFTTRESIISELNEIENSINSILNTASFGKAIHQGLRVVLFGLPNTGKSSLYNTLLGHERTIVSDISGTTRDVVESWFELNGIPVCLIDTAGFATTDDRLESLGVDRTRTELKNADVVFFIDDHDPLTAFKKMGEFIDPDRIIFIKSKVDLQPLYKFDESLRIVCTSSVEDTGFEKLLDRLSEKLKKCKQEITATDPILISARQRNLVEKASLLLKNIISDTKQQVEIDILASLIRDFVQILDEVTGEISQRSVIDSIFKNFCVGK